MFKKIDGGRVYDQPTKLSTDKASSQIYRSVRIHSSELGAEWKDHHLSTPDQSLPPLQKRRFRSSTQKNREIGKKGNLTMKSKREGSVIRGQGKMYDCFTQKCGAVLAGKIFIGCGLKKAPQKN
jgi:hypothetical protein